MPLKMKVKSILLFSTLLSYSALYAANTPANVLCGVPLTDTPIPYQNFSPAVQSIVTQMTLDQKIGQMTLADFALLPARPSHYTQPEWIDNAVISEYQLGAVLVPGNGTVAGCQGDKCQFVVDPMTPGSFQHATLKNWQTLAEGMNQQPTLVGEGKNKIAIYPLVATDAVHGNQHVLGSVLFPQNIGLAATHDPAIFYQVGFWTTQNVKNSGFNWIYAPTVAVSQNPQWGRYYESMGSNPQKIADYAYCFTQGAQIAKNDRIEGTLMSVKHYLGDGATAYGADEGNVEVSNFDQFLSVNTTGYQGAINASAGSAMISYSAVNEEPMSINTSLLNTLFTGRYQGKQYFKPFQGFTVSDYGAVDKVAHQGLPTTTNPPSAYTPALAKTINAGVDMIMLSPWPTNSTVPNFKQAVKDLVNKGEISQTRIDEAVTRILTTKYAMGLVHLSGQTDAAPASLSVIDPNNDQIAKVALNAAEKSLVLLKNENKKQQPVLPLAASRLKYIVLVGEKTLNVKQADGSFIPQTFQSFNNIGAQNGGWTISWQGFEGNDYWEGENKRLSHASSILDGVVNLTQHAVNAPKVLYPHYQAPLATPTEQEQFLTELKNQLPDMNGENTVIIATLAETPSAEFMGDINIPYCANNSSDATQGCLYNQHLNQYTPDQQDSTLAINLDAYSQSIIQLIQEKDADIPVVSVLFSGRPMIISQPANERATGFIPLKNSDAFIAAWLPGTTGGEAIANALFGHYTFCNGFCMPGSPNTLPVDWLANMEQLAGYPNYQSASQDHHDVLHYQDPLFKEGYGLATRRAQ